MSSDVKSKPGRKEGFRFKKDEKGNLIKKDGTIAKKPGRKPKKRTSAKNKKDVKGDMISFNLKQKSLNILDEKISIIEKGNLTEKQLDKLKKEIDLLISICSVF